MKKVKLWIKSFRLKVSISAGLLVHVGFVLNHQSTDWLLALEAFLIAVFAMVSNDYVDRLNDLKKGKSFAYEHPNEFKIVLVLGWGIIWTIIFLYLFPYNKLLIPVSIISMFYSYTRKIPYLQTLCVAFASASPLIFANNVTIPLLTSQANSFMFVAVLLCIFGREIIKDIEDAETDVGWKYTPVSMGWITKKAEQQVAGGFIGAGVFICLVATSGRILESHPLIIFIWFAGIMLCGSSPPTLYVKDDTKLGKKLFDIGMLCILFSLSIA